jgi:tape measure domain-containing protein
MAEQLNIQFGVDASRVVQAAEQAGALAGKLFGKQFNQSAEQELDDVEVQLDLNFKGEDQAKKATKSIDALKEKLNKATEAKNKAKAAADKMALADAKAANKKKALANAIGKVPLKAHAKQLQTAINKLKALQGQTTKGSEAYKRLGTSIKGLNTRLANIKGTSGPMSILGSAVKSLTGKFALANVAAGLLTDTIRALGSFVMNSFAAFTQRTKDVEALTLALQNSGVAGNEVQSVFGSIKATALTFGTSITDVSAAWKRLAPAVLAAGGTLKDTENVIVSMSARAVGLGLNAEQTGRYMEALAQVMGKGKLQGQELTQQLSQLDGALRGQIEQDLQNSVEGFTTLEEEMRKGAVSAEMFFESFNRISQGAVDNLTGQMFNLSSQIKSSGDAAGLTLQQIENKIETLNTLSLDKFAAVFDEFGRSMLRIQAGWTQLVFSITQSAPMVMSLISAAFSGIGKAVEITFQSLFGVIKLFVLALEGVLLPLKGFGDLMKSLIPPDLQDKIGGIAKAFWNMNNKMFDSIMNMGTAGKKQISFLEEVDKALENNQGNWEKMGEKLKGIIEENISKLDLQVEALKEMYEEEKAQIRDVIEAQKEKLAEEKAIYDETKQKINERYDEEMTRIDDLRRALDEAYGKDIEAINKKTEAEKRLDAIRKEELIAKTRNLALSEKERVAAQAQLDAMIRREKKEARRLQFKQDDAKLDAQAVEAENKKGSAIEKSNRRYEERKKAIEETIKAEEKGIAKIDGEIRNLDNTIRSMKNYEKGAIFENKQAALNAINAQISQLSGLITKWNEVAAAARAAAAAGNGAGGGGGDNAATGGPVSGGRTYTVNEVGQEAFLSAAGKLSMINTPAWGQWTAPSSGTVIPAHLTQQLDVPKGGIKLNGGGGPRFSREKLMSKSGGQKSVAFIRSKMGKAAKKASGLNTNIKSQNRKKKDQISATLNSPKIEASIPSFPKSQDNKKKRDQVFTTLNSPKRNGKKKRDQVFATLNSPKIEASIPAFVSKQIDIPSTKVKSNQSSSASSVSGGSALQIARAIKGMQGGDTISNSVTVQAVNPAQTANSMMVQMTKLKRLRYS